MALPGKYILPVFFLTLFLGAMILGPLLYFGLAVVWPIPFHRAMDRAMLISAVAALGLFWSRIPLEKLWPCNSDAWKQLLLGYFIAAVSIQAMIGAYLALARFESAHLSVDKVVGRVALALVAALLVPPLEETVFRGFLQRELVKGLGWCAGWLITAVIFMLAHFLKIPVELDHEPVHLWSGVTALGAAFADFGHEFSQLENVCKAINLSIIGLILGGVFLRAGTLWLNAGLHSGWIFGLLMFTGLTRPNHFEESIIDMLPGSLVKTHTVDSYDSPLTRLTDLLGGDILSSPATTLVLILTGLWLWRFYRHPSISPEPACGTGPNAP